MHERFPLPGPVSARPAQLAGDPADESAMAVAASGEADAQHGAGHAAHAATDAATDIDALRERHGAEVYWRNLPGPHVAASRAAYERFRFDLRRTLEQLRTAFSPSAR
jgi:hypothetical protein